MFMKKILIALFTLISIIGAPLNVLAKKYVYITSTKTGKSESSKLVEERIVVITTDDGALSRKFISELEKNGGILFPNSVLYKNTLKPIVYREITITGQELTLQDEIFQKKVFVLENDNNLIRFIYLSLKQISENKISD